jgi:hypothetical protein
VISTLWCGFPEETHELNTNVSWKSIDSCCFFPQRVTARNGRVKLDRALESSEYTLKQMVYLFGTFDFRTCVFLFDDDDDDDVWKEKQKTYLECCKQACGPFRTSP